MEWVRGRVEILVENLFHRDGRRETGDGGRETEEEHGRRDTEEHGRPMTMNNEK